MTLSPEEFRIRWCDDEDEVLNSLSTESMTESLLTDDARVFLVRAGLPDSAAPFLEFRIPESGPLPRVADEWQQAKEFGDFSQCFVIGFDGSGDPICLDQTQDGQIVVLNHDNRFQRMLLNSSLPLLAESLLLYRQFVRDTLERNGEDAWLDGEIPDDLLKWIQEELQRIDPVAVQHNHFWSCEIERLQEEFD